MIRWLFPVVIFGVALALYRDLIVADRLVDENAFVAAFELVAKQRSPYDSAGYLYPPPLAEWGARSMAHFGLRATQLALRVLNVAGAALIAWVAACLATRRFRARAAVSVVLLFAPPFIHLAVKLGNPSALAAGLIGCGVLHAYRRPTLASIPIGISLAIKPMALGALVVLALDRRTRRIAPLAALVAALLIAPTPRYLLPMLRQKQTLDAFAGGNISVHRVLALVGLAPPAAVTSAVVVALFAMWASRMSSERARLCVALTASVFSLPRVWGHTLALFVPVFAIAVAGMPVRALPGEDRDARSRRLLRVTLTACAAVGLLLYDGLSFLPIAPRAIQALLAAVPILSACALLHFATQRDATVAL